jgi:hypothetical protein
VARTPTVDLQAALKEVQEQSPGIQDKTISAKEVAEVLDTPAMSALEDHVWAELEQFREGVWQVDLEDLNRQAANAKAELIESILPSLREKITEEFPSLEEGRDAQLVDWFVDTLGPKLIENELNDQLEKTGLRDPMALIWAGLEDAARASGDPGKLGHEELAGYLPVRALDVTTVSPMKIATRSNHVGLVLVWGFGLLCIVLAFQSAEFTRRKDWHGRSWRWLKCKVGRGPEASEGSEQQPATVPLSVDDESSPPTDV